MTLNLFEHASGNMQLHGRVAFATIDMLRQRACSIPTFGPILAQDPP